MLRLNNAKHIKFQFDTVITYCLVKAVDIECYLPCCDSQNEGIICVSISQLWTAEMNEKLYQEMEGARNLLPGVKYWNLSAATWNDIQEKIYYFSRLCCLEKK
jgi:hypothetical protein